MHVGRKFYGWLCLPTGIHVWVKSRPGTEFGQFEVEIMLPMANSNAAHLSE